MRWSRATMVLSVVIALSGSLWAATIRLMSEAHLDRSRLAALERTSLSMDALSDSLQAVMASAGYWDAVIQVRGDTLAVDPGKRILIGQVRVTGDTSLTIQVSEAFDSTNLTGWAASFLDQYRDQGYRFAAADWRLFERAAGHINAELQLVRGPLITLSRLQFEGLQRTDPRFLASYLPLHPGDTLTDAALREVEDAAASLDWLRYKPSAELVPEPGLTSAALRLHFTEPPQLHLAGAAAYAPDTPGGVLWALQAAITNPFGRGRTVLIDSERRQRGHNSLQLRYRQPMSLFGAGSIGLSVATRDYRDQFYEFGVAGEVRTRPRRNCDIAAGLGWKMVSVVENRPSYERLEASLSLMRVDLDDRFNPTAGSHLGWQVTYAHRGYDSDSLVTGSPLYYNDTRIEILTDWFLPLSGPLVGHLRLEYQGLETSEPLPPTSELILVGGPPALRGYSSEQFPAIRTVLLGLEPRWRFSQGNLFVFYDGAYINNRLSRPAGPVATDESYWYGYGFGLSAADENRAIELSLGWNPDVPFDQPRLAIKLSSGI